MSRYLKIEMIRFISALIIILQFQIINTDDTRIELANYDYPRANNSSKYLTIAILGTNDIHGAAFETKKIYNNISYDIGGYNLISGVIKIYRKEFKKNFLWFDAGDQFQGTLENTITKGNLIKDFYNIMKPDAFALGNHEWDWGEEWLLKMMRKEKSNFLISNMKRSNKNVKKLPNSVPYKIFNFDYGIKIGVIGLTTIQTIFTTSHPPTNYSITKYLPAIHKYSKLLRQEFHVNAVLILSHVGIHCERSDLMELKLRKPQDQQGRCETGELLEILNNLNNSDTNSMIDGIIGGHVHSTVNDWINGVPVIQNPMSGSFVNTIYLRFNKKTKKLEKNKTLIEGPIPICSMVYSHNKRCDLFELEKNKKLIFFNFHGKAIHPVKRVAELLNAKTTQVSPNPYLKKLRKVIRAKADVISLNRVPILKRNPQKDNFLGNFICDCIREFMKTDFCFLNNGSLRSIWDIGPLTVYDVVKMFPFKNYAARVKVSGKVLKKITKTLQEGIKAYYPSSGLKIKVLQRGNMKRLISVTKDDGEAIDDEKMYTLSAPDFLINGGDDWSNVGKFFNPERLKLSEYTLKHLIISKLRSIGEITKESHNFSNNKRLLIIKRKNN